jgi:hypothetical protein
MPSLSLNIGLNNGRKLPFGGFDPDAAAYFTTAGVTDATAKQQISDFVVGVKALGLYNNMACWTLRSTQNSGTNIAYSLGGLGTFNGTLTNGPTWGTDGVLFDGVNDYIGTGLGSIKNGNTSFHGFTVCSSSTISGTRIALRLFPHWLGIQSGLIKISTDGAEEISTSLTANTFSGISINQNGSSLQLVKDGTSIGTTPSSVALSGSGITIASYTGSILFWEGTISTSIFFNVSLSTSSASALYSLYKTTLGQGLSLP